MVLPYLKGLIVIKRVFLYCSSISIVVLLYSGISWDLNIEIHDMKTHVCRLKKALYGLKQAPRAWYGRIDNFMMSLGFTKSKEDPNLYYKIEDSGPMILLLYVHDLFLTRDEKLIAECKRNIASELDMKYLGMMHYFLGLEVWQKPNKIFLIQ
jgi:hypothetical protein